MSWGTTQLKYQLLRISEILLAWAKFSKSPYYDEIKSQHTDLLVEKWTLDDLEVVKMSYWSIIKQSNDARLYEDLKDYFDEDDYQVDSTSMTSIS